ncbi:hypothetical protein J4217_02900 [Candidatus Pacearchaeota archaeon]|nr:hypothetical protein [Candidatus Pacearchaeota archaeon]
MTRIISVEKELEAVEYDFNKEFTVHEAIRRTCPGINIKNYYGILEASRRLGNPYREKGKIGESSNVVR